MSKDKMTPFELWVQNGTNGIHLKNGNAIAITYGTNKTQHAIDIVSAVNNTYGAGINPEAVPEVIRTLKNMCEYFEWLIKDPNFPAYREAKAAIEKAKL